MMKFKRPGNSIFTEEQARHIKFKLARPVEQGGEGRPVKEIAEVYGVAVETVRKLLRGDTWGNLRDEAAMVMPEEVSQEIQAKTEESMKKFREMMAGGVDEGKE